MDDSLTLLDESARWRARDVTYLEGPWKSLREALPVFEKQDFAIGEGEPANPHLRAVVRLPLTVVERPIPVATVSAGYTLAQHRAVGDMCLEGIAGTGVDPSELRWQVGLTELGEWMNLRIYFPKRFDHDSSDKNRVGLRLECFNSVDGSRRLELLLGWFRFVCSNGMIVGETKASLSDIHNERMDIGRIPEVIASGLHQVEGDRRRLKTWESTLVGMAQLGPWVDGTLSDAWGKKAACRTFHICYAGYDVEYADPFAPGAPTTKPVRRTERVRGAPSPANNLYDVSQALSWIASGRTNPDERVVWQSQISTLIDALAMRLS